MVATAKRALDALTGREAPTTDPGRRWLERTRELTVGADGFQIKYEAQRAITARRVEAALSATPANEFHLVELQVLDKNLDRAYTAAILDRLITPDRELVVVSGDEEAAVHKLTRRTEPARFTVTRWNDSRGSSWNDTIDVPVPELAETFLKLRTTFADRRRDDVAIDAESASIKTAVAAAGPRVQAALVANGKWAQLTIRDPQAIKWLRGADFVDWLTEPDWVTGVHRDEPFITRLVSADGLRGWLRTQLAAAAEKNR